MSFILDALKKSDRSRLDGRVPDIKTVHDQVPQRTATRPGLKFWLLAVLLLNAGLLFWWQQPRAPLSGAKTTVAAPVRQPQSSRPLTAGVKRTAPAAQSLVTTPRVEPATPTAAPAPQAQRAKHVVQTRPRPSTLEKPISGLSSPSKHPLPFEVRSKPQIYQRSELPASIRSELPKMQVSLHYYTDNPQERMVRIDDRILREGQQLSEGLVLEKIVPSGSIFSYKGYRFKLARLGVNR